MVLRFITTSSTTRLWHFDTQRRQIQNHSCFIKKIFVFEELKIKKLRKQTNVKIEEFNPFTEWTNSDLNPFTKWTNSDPHRLLSNVNEQE